jgi:predicted TIM-barrel fold metal-dependent hydrolase
MELENLRLVSADSHVVEPGDVWTTRMECRWGDRIPRVVVGHGGQPGAFFVCEDVPPFGIAAFSGADVAPEELPAHFTKGYERVRPGGWDPTARLRDQERDGVVAEVVYPSLALQLFRIRDAAFQAATFRAYNDWLATFCSAAPERLAGIALVPLHDVAQGVAELERAAGLGLRGAMIWSSAPDDRPYSEASYEPFWAAAEAARLPLSLHLGTGAVPLGGTAGMLAVAYMFTHHAAQRSISQMIFGGVFERHPGLRIVSVENDIGWIPHYLDRLDHAGEKFRAFHPHLRLRPSEYFRRQVAATFQEDRIGIRLRDAVGRESLLWASDYPHTDSTWPRSREVIARDFVDVPATELGPIVCDNAARLYGLTVPSPRAR